jgi:hypothetical protein
MAAGSARWAGAEHGQIASVIASACPNPPSDRLGNQTLGDQPVDAQDVRAEGAQDPHHSQPLALKEGHSRCLPMRTDQLASIEGRP